MDIREREKIMVIDGLRKKIRRELRIVQIPMGIIENRLTVLIIAVRGIEDPHLRVNGN